MGEEQPPRVEDELIHLIVNRCPWWAYLTVLDKLIMYCESYNWDALNELMADRAYDLEGQPPDCRCSTVRITPGAHTQFRFVANRLNSQVLEH